MEREIVSQNLVQLNHEKHMFSFHKPLLKKGFNDH